MFHLINSALFLDLERNAVPTFNNITKFLYDKQLEIIDNNISIYKNILFVLIVLDLCALWKSSKIKKFNFKKVLKDQIEIEIEKDKEGKEILENFCGCIFCYAQRF